MKLFRSILFHWTPAFLLAALFTACAHKPASAGPATTAGGEPRVFQVKGVIEKLEADGKTVVIQHETIPNYMNAMTMPFEVKDTRELIGLSPGDVVAFRMIVTEKEGWIDQIQKIGSTNSAAATKKREAFRKAPIVEPLNVGEAVPDYRFTNELGQAIGLSQFRGKALAIVFFYTRCPYPNFCPRMSNNFLDVQKKLKALPHAPENWHLLSISFDPAYDTPARLKTYADGWHYDPDHWSFATADLWTIDGITEQFGMQFWREDGGVVGHNVRTVILDARGRVQRIIMGNTWTPDEAVAEIVKAAQVK